METETMYQGPEGKTRHDGIACGTVLVTLYLGLLCGALLL